MRSAALSTLAKLLVGMLLGLAVVDLWAGRLGGEREASEEHLFVRHPVLGWTNRPGFVDARTRLDSRGLRSPELPDERPEGELRILVVGASQVFGLGVADEETWRSFLEAELAERYGRGRVRVLNGAVQGYSTAQICRRAMLLIPELEPDLVVAFVYPGRQSLLDPSSATRWVEHGGQLLPADLTLGWPEALAWIPRASHGVLRHSNLYARHRARAWRGDASQAERHFVISRAPRRPEVQRLLDATREVVGELVALARAREVAIRLVLLPELYCSTETGWERFLELHQADGAPPMGTPRREPIEALAEWLAPTGAVVWDFDEAALYIGGNPESHVQDSTRHWSPAGHRGIALALMRSIEQEGLLERILEARRPDPR